MRAWLAGSALCALAACGGSIEVDDNPDPPPGPDSFAIGSDGSGTLSFTGYAGSGNLYGGNDVSTVDLATGAVTGAPFAGTLNSTRTAILQSGTARVTLTNPGATEYVRFFDQSPQIGEPISGVVGFLTDTVEVPTSGASRYTGAGSIVVTDNSAIYALDATAEVIANFGAGTVDIELGGLNGTRSGILGGNPGVTTISNGGSLFIDGGRISGSSFSGGFASTLGTPFGFSGNQNAGQTNGGFFGPDADEVAGRIVVSDPVGGVQVLGRFATD